VLANAKAELVLVEALFRELGVSLKERPCLWCDTYLSTNLIFDARRSILKLAITFFVNELRASTGNQIHL
jgi:hypothetical protein